MGSSCKDEALLLLGREPIRRALEGSPDPFAADPEPKKSGMSHFQPDALTISRGADWEDRRRFTDAVLGEGMSSLADRFAAVCLEEASSLPTDLEQGCLEQCNQPGDAADHPR